MYSEAPLATTSDVAEVLGRALTPDELTVATIRLVRASVKFRQAAERPNGWTSQRGRVRVKVDGGEAVLPEPPDQIVSVEDEDGRPVPYQVAGLLLRTPLSSCRMVWVDYEWSSVAPADVVEVVAGMVARTMDGQALTLPPGVESYADTTGPFRDTTRVAKWAQGGSRVPNLSDADRAVAKRHSPYRGHVWVVGT